MKKWENPYIDELVIGETNTELCYCENGIDEEIITYCGGKPHRPGHQHKPGGEGKPDRPGRPCPPNP